MKDYTPKPSRQKQPHRRVRVAFITNFIPHYRSTFYRKLAAIPELDLLLVHGAAEGDLGRPGMSRALLPEVNTLQVVNRKIIAGPFTLRWQAGALAAARSFNPHVIVVLGISGTLSNWLLLLWARIRKIGNVMWTCGWEAQTTGSVAYKFKRIFLKLFYRLPRKMLVYSSAAKEYVCALGIPEDHCVICYNGLNISEDRQTKSKISTAATRLREKINCPAAPLFLYAGGLLPEKNVELLLRAFARLHAAAPATLWLVGDGPCMSALRALADKLNLQDVVFYGRIIADVDKYFAAADYFVLPGVGGLALNQAMFWKTPCICSAADGTEQDLVFDAVTGFTFTANDEDSLLQAMQNAVNLRRDQAAYAHMTAEAHKLIINRSNVDVMTRTFHNALLEQCRQLPEFLT